MFQNLRINKFLCVYVYMYIHVHTCSAIPMPEKNDTEFGDDNNDIMAFNT